MNSTPSTPPARSMCYWHRLGLKNPKWERMSKHNLAGLLPQKTPWIHFISTLYLFYKWNRHRVVKDFSQGYVASGWHPSWSYLSRQPLWAPSPFDNTFFLLGFCDTFSPGSTWVALSSLFSPQIPLEQLLSISAPRICILFLYLLPVQVCFGQSCPLLWLDLQSTCWFLTLYVWPCPAGL